MTPTRMAPAAIRFATIILPAVVWVVAAALLWRTSVPDGLRLPRLDAAGVFPTEHLERTARFERFLRVDVLLALAGQLAVLGLVARRGPALARRLPGPALGRAVVLGALCLAAVWLVRLPFGYAAHRWQRRYGLDPRGDLDWLVDRLPSPIAPAVTLAAVAALVVLGRRLGPRWWVAAAPLAVAAAVLAVLVQPLATTLRPLRDPSLAADLDALARRQGLDGVQVGVERASKRTRQANAEAVGLGPTRRIVFWDTVLDGRFRRDEVRVLAAHEVAHHARQHPWKGLAWFALFALPAAYAVARAARRRGGPGDPGAVPTVLLAVAVLQVVSLPLVGALSRRYEAEADWEALRATRDPAAAKALFRRFSEVNLDQPRPPRWAFVLFADHPSLLDRIAMAEAWAASRGGGGPVSTRGAPPTPRVTGGRTSRART
jgi:STE24 endopeptidase